MWIIIGLFLLTILCGISFLWLFDETDELKDRILLLEVNLKLMHDMGPATCKTCGGNLFVHVDDEWLCKSCREPAPLAFSGRLDNPEERTLN